MMMQYPDAWTDTETLEVLVGNAPEPAKINAYDTLIDKYQDSLTALCTLLYAEDNSPVSDTVSRTWITAFKNISWSGPNLRAWLHLTLENQYRQDTNQNPIDIDDHRDELWQKFLSEQDYPSHSNSREASDHSSDVSEFHDNN